MSYEFDSDRRRYVDEQRQPGQQFNVAQPRRVRRHVLLAQRALCKRNVLLFSYLIRTFPKYRVAHKKVEHTCFT